MGELASEFAGTFILILFGVGVVAQVVAAGIGDHDSIAWAWGLGVVLGVYTAGKISGGHINPAVTVALAVFRGFPWRKVGPYALAQTAGLTVLRMADADIMPYDFEGLSNTVGQYIDEVKALLETRRKEAEDIKRNLADGVYEAVNDPRNPTVAPPAREIPPYLNFAPLDNAAAALNQAAAQYSKALAAAQGKSLALDRLQTINQQLALAERKLTNEQGLPRRPWMKHLLYAPGWYTGYSAKTMPGVREAIEEGRYAEAEEQVALVARALQDEAAWIEQITKELNS